MLVITGAAGFIGSHLAHRLARMGRDLLLVDHPLTASKSANWVGLKEFRYIEQDVFQHWLGRGTVLPEAVFHLGACSATTETDWEYLRRNNVEYSQMLWEWCAREGCPFIYASSAATYGDGAAGFDDRVHPSRLRPLNLYGKSKNDFDFWALEQRAGPPKWAGLKFFNVYGPRERHKGRMASVVWQAYRQVQESGRVRLFRSTHPDFADGGQQRDFVHVEDCIRHLLWFWQSTARPGLYNSGTGSPRTFLDLANAVFAALDQEPRIDFIDMPAELARQYQNFTRADMTKLRDAGFSQPATSLEEGVRATIRCLTP